MDGSTSTRSIALVGPNGAGKTTLMESMLFVTGTIARKGRTVERNTVGDSSAEARERQMSTEVTAATLVHEGVEMTILDCPGSVEFVQEARNALIGVDLAVVVVEPVKERMIAVAPLLHFLDQQRVPHMVMINKMDRSERGYRGLLQALRRVSARPIVPHQYAIGRGESLVGWIDLVTEEAHHYNRGAPSEPMPIPEEYRQKERETRVEMLETLADFDDELMESLLEDHEPPADQIIKDLRLTLGADQVVPVVIGAAEHDMGVRALLDTIVREAPEPSLAAERAGVAGDGPALVQVLKTYSQPHAGKLSLVRVWRGTVKDGMTLGGMRVGGLFRPLGGQTTAIASAEAGAIVCLGRLEDARTGQTLAAGAGEPEVALPQAPSIKPMFAFGLTAANRNDEVKLSQAFARLAEEDPSLVLEQDAETHQTLLWGQGEIHLRVALDRLRHKFNIEVVAQPPRTSYRETIRKAGPSHGRHKKQSGGHGQFADVKLEIRPRSRGEGFSFDNRIVGGAVPKQYIPAVEHGAREFMVKGPLGFPVVDVGVTLTDGQFHAVDSNEMAFRTATGLALREGLAACQPVLLEPVLSVTISVPSDYTAKALQLITTRRGQILGYAGKDGWPGWDETRANIPQSEMHDLIVSLRSQSQGVGFFEWQYDHLEEVPDKLAQAIVAQQAHAAA